MTKPNFNKKPIIDIPSKEQLEELMNSKYDIEITPSVQEKVDKLIEFFGKSKKPFSLPKFDLKKAYPNYDDYINIPGQHNTQKWIQAVKDIYSKEKEGNSRVLSIRKSTSGWNVMETFDFLNWLKFHEAGEHLKYKFAALWYENDEPGFMIPIKPDKDEAPQPQASGKDIDFARDSVAEELTKKERKDLIEKQRNKIIGRLDSAEKLLRSPDGQMFSGKEFESLLETIYQLKKKIHLVNKVSTSTRLYDDMIVREANILHKNGFIKAAEMLYSVAQTPGQSDAVQGDPQDNVKNSDKVDLAPAASPGDPSGAGHPGAPGGLPSMGPGMPQNAPSASAPETGPNEMSAPTVTTPKGISDFLDALETSNITTEDSLEVNDSDDLLVTEAQVAPPAAALEDVPMTDSPMPSKLKETDLDPTFTKPPSKPSGKSPSKPLSDEPLEVTEEDVTKNPELEESHESSNFDKKVDAIFADITIADVVAKLEVLAKFYKTREAPRQLGIVDMMLDSLGIASYFPSLAEATNKSLESNNYISTRVEDILSKLRGAMDTEEIDLQGNDVDRPDVAGIKGKLKDDADKEKSRKQQRKEQEIADLEGKDKETPEIEIEEDLAGPSASPPPAASAKPVTAPPARPVV